MCTSRPPSLPCRSCSCPLFSGVSCGPGSFASPCRDGAGNRKSTPWDVDVSPSLVQFLFCRCRRALAVHLDHQYLAVIRRRFPSVASTALLAGPDPTPGARSPRLRGTTPRRLTDHPTGRITHPCGQPCHELHHPRRETVPGQTQRHVQGMKTGALFLPDQMRPGIADLPERRLEGPLGIGIA